jgi:hypothetical protein
LVFITLGGTGMVVMQKHWDAKGQPPTTQVVHQRGQEISRLVGSGKVLTLDPVSALEGGLEIYPQLATGPFFWRVAHLMDPVSRKDLNILGPPDLASRLEDDPPDAILTGFEGKQEYALLEYAHNHGYQPQALAQGGVIYLSPKIQEQFQHAEVHRDQATASPEHSRQ